MPGGIGGNSYKVLVLRRAYPTKIALLVRALVLDLVSDLLALGLLLAALACVVPLLLPALWAWRSAADLGALAGTAATRWWFAAFGPTYWRTQALALAVQAAVRAGAAC